MPNNTKTIHDLTGRGNDQDLEQLERLYTTAGTIEAGYYGNNPYHTAVHAADVLQAIHCNIVHSPVGLFICCHRLSSVCCLGHACIVTK